MPMRRAPARPRRAGGHLCSSTAIKLAIAAALALVCLPWSSREVFRQYTQGFAPLWTCTAARREPACIPRDFKHHLTLCTIFRNQTQYAREWVEFHRMAGVDRVVIYEHKATGELAAELRPYIDAGFVEHVRWPEEEPRLVPDSEVFNYGADFLGLLFQTFEHGRGSRAFYDHEIDICRKDDPTRPHGFAECQRSAVMECMHRYRKTSKWVGHWDGDEFMFPTPCAGEDGRAHRTSYPEALGGEFAWYDGFSVEGYVFGTSGHENPIGPGELMIETHTKRGPKASLPWARTGHEPHNAARKSICNPRKAGSNSAHDFQYVGIPNRLRVQRDSIPLRYHHYQYRSRSEIGEKARMNNNNQLFFDTGRDDYLNSVEDRTLADLYVPELRRRLAMYPKLAPDGSEAPRRCREQ